MIRQQRRCSRFAPLSSPGSFTGFAAPFPRSRSRPDSEVVRDYQQSRQRGVRGVRRGWFSLKLPRCRDWECLPRTAFETRSRHPRWDHGACFLWDPRPLDVSLGTWLPDLPLTCQRTHSPTREAKRPSVAPHGDLLSRCVRQSPIRLRRGLAVTEEW